MSDPKPVVLVQRWRDNHDVCAVLSEHAVRWIARDILEALEGDPGHFSRDPGHDRLVVAEHAHAQTWTFEEVRRVFGGDLDGDQLLHWMREREHSLAAIGFGNVVRMGTRPAVLDAPVFSVTDAVDVLNRDPSIETGSRRIFDWLSKQGWIIRRGLEYSPSRTAIDSDLLAVRPRRLPHSGNPWPQIVLTTTGLAELHRLLGGSNPAVLDQEPR